MGIVNMYSAHSLSVQFFISVLSTQEQGVVSSEAQWDGRTRAARARELELKRVDVQNETGELEQLPHSEDFLV